MVGKYYLVRVCGKNVGILKTLRATTLHASYLCEYVNTKGKHFVRTYYVGYLKGLHEIPAEEAALAMDKMKKIHLYQENAINMIKSKSREQLIKVFEDIVTF